MEDQKMIELFFARSEDALRMSDTAYGAYCRSIARSILGNDEDAKEVVNDAYLSAWNSIPPNKPNSLKAYLGKLTRNAAIHRLEKERAGKRGGGEVTVLLSELEECIAASESTEASVETGLLTDALNRFLEGIGKEKRILFLRRYWYNQSVAEIALGLGISEAKVKTTLHRIRTELKLFLCKEGIWNDA